MPLRIGFANKEVGVFIGIVVPNKSMYLVFRHYFMFAISEGRATGIRGVASLSMQALNYHVRYAEKCSLLILQRFDVRLGFSSAKSNVPSSCKYSDLY